MGGPLCDFGQGGGEDSRNQHAVVYDNVGDQATSHRVEGCTVVQNNHPWRATHHSCHPSKTAAHARLAPTGRKERTPWYASPVLLAQ